ncbi:MAG: mandelate racemase/muconate lactonizing enzyme family protein [Burkholderiales bacterium]
MKIVSIETFLLRLPFEHGGPPLTFAGRPRLGMEMLLVRVDTDEGITGWGEAFGPGVWPATRAVIEELLVPMCTGRDCTDIAALAEDLQRKLHPLGRSGPVIFALAGLDIALWDIAAQRAGLPLARLLAADPASTLDAYASLLRYTDPKLVSAKCAEALAAGYRHVKLHEIGVAQARAARAAIGPRAGLMMDVNCPWSPAEAIGIAQELRDLDLLWLEEPVWPPEDHAGIASVRASAGIAIAAGENAATPAEFQHLFDQRAVDYAQPSAIKIGITAMLEVIERARSSGASIMPHSPYFGPGLIATLHVCAARAPAALIEIYFCELEASPLGAAITPVDGRMAVPQKPGLGVVPNADVIRKYAVR